MLAWTTVQTVSNEITLTEDDSSARLEKSTLITATASQAIAEVREIAYNLGPWHLERLGLAGTMTDMIR